MARESPERVSAPTSGWVVLAELPAPYRDAFTSGALPSEPGWSVHRAYRVAWAKAASLLFTIPFGLFALGFPLSWAHELATNPGARERLTGFFARGQYFAGGLGVVLPLGLAVIGVALLAMSWGTFELQWHLWLHRRGLAAGLHRYGLLLGPERLVWRSPATPHEVLSILRRDITGVRTIQRRYTDQQTTYARALELLEITWRQGDAEVQTHIPHVDVDGVNPTKAVEGWWRSAPTRSAASNPRVSAPATRRRRSGRG